MKDKSYYNTAIVTLIISIIPVFTGLGLLAYIALGMGLYFFKKIAKESKGGKWIVIAAIILGIIYGPVMSLLRLLINLGY